MSVPTWKTSFMTMEKTLEAGNSAPHGKTGEALHVGDGVLEATLAVECPEKILGPIRAARDSVVAKSRASIKFTQVFN